MQVSGAATTSNTDTVTLDIPKSEVAMMSKKGYSLVYQYRNSYLMNALMISGRTSLGHGISKHKVNEETKMAPGHF